MPHLMFETFMSQWIWLIIFIFALYYQLVTNLIPKISNSFKVRRDLGSAEVAHVTSAHTGAELSLDLAIPSSKAANSSVYTSKFSKNFTTWSETL